MRTRRRGFRLGAVALAACLSAGCGGGPVNKDNLAKIRPGMPQIEVEKLLGGPGTEIAKADFAKLAGVPADLKLPGRPGSGGPGFPPGFPGKPGFPPGDPKIQPKPDDGKAPDDGAAKDPPKEGEKPQPNPDGLPGPDGKGGPPMPPMPPMPGGPPGMPPGMGMPDLTTATRFLRWGDDNRCILVAFAGDVVVMAFQRGL